MPLNPNPATLEDLIKLVQDTYEDLLDAIQKAKIVPSQVQMTSLSDLSKTLGMISAGEFRAGNGIDPGKGFTGTRISYPALSYSGNNWHVVTANNDVLQVGFNTNGELWSGGGNIRQNASGLYIYNNEINTGAIQADGDVFLGSNITTPSSTSFVVFSNAQTYNGESMSAGDILIGDNSTGKSNIKWSASTGTLYFRSGQISFNIMNSGSSLKTIGAHVITHGLVSIPTGSPTSANNVTFGTIAYDDAGFFNPASDATKLTIPTGYGGRYSIGGEFTINPLGAGTYFGVYVLQNNLGYIAQQTSVGFSGHLSCTTCFIDYTLNDGDYIQLTVEQNSGSSVTGGGDLWITKIR